MLSWSLLSQSEMTLSLVFQHFARSTDITISVTPTCTSSGISFWGRRYNHSWVHWLRTAVTKSIDRSTCEPGVFLGYVSVSVRGSENIRMVKVKSDCRECYCQSSWISPPHSTVYPLEIKTLLEEPNVQQEAEHSGCLVTNRIHAHLQRNLSQWCL